MTCVFLDEVSYVYVKVLHSVNSLLKRCIRGLGNLVGQYTGFHIGGLKSNVILAGSGMGFGRFHFLMNLSSSKTMMEFGVINQN